MRGIATCYSGHAVTVSDSYCSGTANRAHVSPRLSSATPFAVTCAYRVKSSSEKVYFVALTWHTHQRTTISIRDLETGSDSFQQLKRNGGTKTIYSFHFNAEVCWDFSRARYENASPEPVKEFYLLLVVNSELFLVLGTMDEAANVKNFKGRYRQAMFCNLVSRCEHFSGNTVYSTKTRFFSSGTVHDLTIKCAGDDDGSPASPVLSVCIDNKRICQVERLKWNFRGNQTIFLDGLLIDMMWDLHDWFFKLSSHGRAVFMFRTRNEKGSSRLWMEEKNLTEEEKPNEFSLLICASR